MMKLILSRHGETLENQQHILQGQLPGTLSPLGLSLIHISFQVFIPVFLDQRAGPEHILQFHVVYIRLLRDISIKILVPGITAVSYTHLSPVASKHITSRPYIRNKSPLGPINNFFCIHSCNPASNRCLIGITCISSIRSARSVTKVHCSNGRNSRTCSWAESICPQAPKQQKQKQIIIDFIFISRFGIPQIYHKYL